MDIDLLAKMVKEAILDHDTVTLPGVGCFVAELMPSTFSDKGYTINPPYRRLYFSPKQGTDTYLVDLYARDNEEVDKDMATRILTEFLSEMKEVLKVKKTVIFPGLGRLRATRENHFFFVADEDLDIFPEGLGLAPLSLKTHVETPEEVATAVAGLAELIGEPEEEEIPGQAGNDEKVEVPEQVVNEGKKRSWKWLKVVLIVLGALVALLLLFVILSRIAPGLLDPLLYSKEELQVLRY